MSQPSDPTRLDYRASERVACDHFGVDSIMEQDGLALISERATPGEWAKYYIKHANAHDPIFIASAIDAMLTQLVHTEDYSNLDEIRRALTIAQNEPWSCVCITYHTEDYGDFPGERSVVNLIRETIDLDLVQKHAADLNHPPAQGAAE